MAVMLLYWSLRTGCTARRHVPLTNVGLFWMATFDTGLGASLDWRRALVYAGGLLAGLFLIATLFVSKPAWWRSWSQWRRQSSTWRRRSPRRTWSSTCS